MLIFTLLVKKTSCLKQATPDIENHQKLHSNLMVELNVMISKVISHHEYPEDLLDFLNRWLIGHIGQHDQNVAKHILTVTKRPVADNIYEKYLST